ncbi:hypothetical protein ACQ4PT_038292 [Festuca glaucescens]
MAGRGRGHNRRGQNNAEPELPPPPTMAQVLNNIETNRLRNEQLLERVAQNTEHRPDNCVTLGDFICALPPVFTHPKEPLDADDWLRTIECKFNALHVPPGERVNFATYQLEGAAGSWWEGFLALQAPGHDVTWEEFVTAFRAAYIPKTVMDIKRRKFLDFPQGKLDVETYGREFTQLSRYAPRDVVDDADKQDLFSRSIVLTNLSGKSVLYWAPSAIPPSARMAGRGRGHNRRGQNNAEPELPPPPTMAQVLNNIETNRLRNEQLLERVAQNTERRPDNCVTLGDFIRALPPVFTHPKEPLDADDWLRTIERKFNALHVPPGERVNFATYQLEGAAGSWWEGFLALQVPGHDVTWEEFVTAFRAAYIPKTVMDIKRREFLDFTQGKLDVETYGREFTQLSRYAPRDVVDDADKQDLFRKGLNPELCYEMLPFTFQSFQDLHNHALLMENGRKDMEKSKRR